MDAPQTRSHAELTTPTPWAAIAGIIATVSVFALAQGLTYPLLTFILAKQGTSSGVIGLSAAMTPLGFIVSSPLVPLLARRFGAGPTALTCAALAALLLAAIAWSYSLAAWFPLRFLLGAVVNPLYILNEVWMITLAPPERRGRLMGIYTALIAGGFAAGPLSLYFVGSEGWPPFLVGIAAFVGCGACLASVLGRLPELGGADETASVATFIPQARLLLFSVVVAAAFEQGILSLLPVYGFGYGIVEASMSALLAVLIAGNIALQVPLGLAAERLSARKVLIVCAAGSALGCLLLPILIETPLIWPLAFVLGALSYGIYTMSLVELGERFSGPMLVAGNAAFSLTWGVGGLAGTPATGAVMDAIGIQGLPLTLGLICLALACAALLFRPARHGGES